MGHGGLKEGQVVNKMLDEYQQDHKKEITDAKVLEAAAEANKDKEKLQHCQIQERHRGARASTTWRCVFPNAAARCPGTRSWAL